MNRTANIVRMHLRNPFMLLALPWIIILSSFTINFIISLFIDEQLFTGGMISIFIFIFVTGIVMVPQTFPLALGLGSTRRDYYIGTVLTGALIGVLSSVVTALLGIVERASGSWGTGLHFFDLPYLNDGSVAQHMILYFLIYMLFFLGGLGIASVYRCVGRSSLLALLVLLLITGTLLSFFIDQNNWWSNIFAWFASYTAFELSLWTAPLSLALGLLSYLMLRRSVV